MKHKLFILIILFVALVLKLHNYSVYPQRGASSDEYTYSFLGLSLLTKGVPISWSNFNIYQNLTHLTISNLYFPIVQPYFDHPPLNGLFVASWALINGENTFEKISLKTIRLVPIFFSLISAVLVYLITKKIYNKKVAIWALLIYTTATIFVMNGRVVFAENLLTVWYLLTIYLWTLWSKKITVNRALILGIIAGLSIWTKELGVTIFLTSLFFLLKNKCRLNSFIIYHLAFGIFFLGYLGYGAYYNWELFLKIIFAQSSRELGPETLQMLLHHPIIVNKPYDDGWYFLGFVSLFTSLWDFRKHLLSIVPALIYFFLMLFSLTREGEMGWYMIPLFPFMSILTAVLLYESVQKQNWFMITLPLFVGLSQIRYLFSANFGLAGVQFRIFLILMFIPFFLCAILNRKKLFMLLGNFWFYLLIIGNMIQTYTYIHPA